MTPPRLVELDDVRALSPDVVGAKGAALARARRAGLPVLDGFVVEATAGLDAMAIGTAALPLRGSGGARLAVTAAPIDATLDKELTTAAAVLGPRLVVRSSGVVEAGPVWSGAFASYAEIAPDEVSRAVRGCWASVFGPDALGRGEAEGIAPDEVGMAVLVQRELIPTYGGTATVGSGTVTITGIAGRPALIVSGWERGEVAQSTADGRLIGDDAVARLGADRLARVADLARRAQEVTGGDLIEWAFEGDELWLLQVGPVALRLASEPSAPALPPEPGLAGLVELLVRFSGALGEHLVLSWAVGLEELPDPVAPPDRLSAAETLSEARRLASVLTAGRWRGPEAASFALAGKALAELRGADPVAALATWSDLGPVDGAAAGRLLGLVAALGERLAVSGRLREPAMVWRLSPDELEELDTGGGGPDRRLGMGRWEPLLYGAVAALGVPSTGTAIAPGTGAGRLDFVGDAGAAAISPPRAVVAAHYPLSNLAPLLWEAAGLVTIGGSPGAHLFEVAAALGVPAVCGVDLTGATGATPDELQPRRDLAAAVDGETGVVSLLGLRSP